jgi:hypothetical protein
VISLLQSLLSEALPTFLAIESLSHLVRDIQVSTLQSEVEAHVLVLNEVKRDLRETLLLKISDDALTKEIRSLDDVEHFVVIVPRERELEPVLRWVERNRLGAPRPVQTVHGLTLHTCKVDGVIKSADHAMITKIRCQRFP